MTKYTKNLTEESNIIDVKIESDDSPALDETINENDTSDIHEIIKCTFTFILVATLLSLIMYLILNSYAS